MLRRRRRADAPHDLTYENYLCLDRLLDAQRPISEPPHHDELLFIVQHQTTELWVKLILHELDDVVHELRHDRLRAAFRSLDRIFVIQRQLVEQWSVIATLKPDRFAEFRPVLGGATGFQSVQLRMLEYRLGDKRAELVEEYDGAFQRDALREALVRPTVYDEFIRFLHRAGHPVPVGYLDRVHTCHEEPDQVIVAVLRRVYEDRHAHAAEYEMAERLVELEERHQMWRFRHMRTVRRIIGDKHGTGGSRGVPYLASLVNRPLFPEIYAARTVLDP
ncbi:tryptophan 2,3-dioxygenase [Streptosporangium saharense]|uniref:tryptophan 2,3-dioxygenase n=1 Tax=Streptosporangium saharense TaxID=1706840 RepID=UPI0036941238